MAMIGSSVCFDSSDWLSRGGLAYLRCVGGARYSERAMVECSVKTIGRKVVMVARTVRTSDTSFPRC